MLGEVITAIVTPFDRDGQIDFEAFSRLALHLLDHGSEAYSPQWPKAIPGASNTVWEVSLDNTYVYGVPSRV